MGTEGDRPRRARDARPDVRPSGVRRRAAASRCPHHRLAAHDDPDGGAHRDAGRARRGGALVLVQHLLDAGSRRGSGRGRAGRHAGRAQRDPGLRLEGRDARGVLVVHRAGADLARRRPEHAARRRRRRDPARPQGRRVRARGRGAGSGRRRLGGVPDRARGPAALARVRPAAVDGGRGGDQGRDRGDDDRRAPPVPDGRRRNAALPGDQRQRLGHQEQVRQPLRLPALARRRHQPRRRPDARRASCASSAATATSARARRSRCAPRALASPSPRSIPSAPCRR